MECLEYINFGGTGIKELPSSIENLIGVKTLDLSGCTKLKYLEIPCIGDLDGIIQPFFLNSKYLSFTDCSKVAKFIKTMEDMRQSMLGVVSIEESAISSVAELLQLPPSTNTSDSNDGCSSIVFPKLRALKLQNCALSGSNLFRTFDCCSTLTELDLSMSDIVTIPPYIRRFVGLKFLYLEECKQLQEILRIPPNLISMSAKGCVSLAIFKE
jgi:Leucine-rich repeat (LRR) protein